jgi:hypothetical protein
VKLLASIAPLDEAVEMFGRKSIVASTLRSKDWEGVAERIRIRALWSAGIDHAKFLSTVQDKFGAALAIQREKVERGEAIVDRSSFIRDLRRVALGEGLGDGRGGLTDPASRVRLGLIYDMQLRMAQGFAQRKMDLDADVLDAFPAQELYRAEQRRVERDWESRWQAAGEKVGWQGASRERMVALKTSPIWTELSVFRTPWAPFDWGSGMDLRDIDREEVEALGLLQPSQEVPRGEEPDITDNLEASVAGLSEQALADLARLFGDKIEISAGKARWRAAA